MTKAAELAKMGEVLTNSQIGGRRNIVINGAMQVAQRATSATGLGGSDPAYQTLDRFRMNIGGTSAGRFTMAQVADVHDGFANALKLTCTTADTSIAADEVLSLQTRLEAQNLQQLKKGTSDAEKVTVSFYVKGNASATYTLELEDENSRRIADEFSVTTNWTRVVKTFGGDTSGSLGDDNALGLSINIFLHGGSNFTSGTFSANTWESISQTTRLSDNQTSFFDSTDRTFFITGLQMEVGEQATPFEHRSFGEELILCQRYFFQLNGIGTEYATMGAGAMYQAAVYLGAFQLPVAMRTRPSFSLNNSLSSTNFSVVTGGNVKAISGITPTGDNQHLRINAAITSNGTVGHGAYIQLQSSHNVLWDSEL